MTYSRVHIRNGQMMYDKFDDTEEYKSQYFKKNQKNPEATINNFSFIMNLVDDEKDWLEQQEILEFKKIESNEEKNHICSSTCPFHCLDKTTTFVINEHFEDYRENWF